MACIAKISDIFKSIQGEGPYQGVSQVFIRFFGCNLKCQFCDTALDSYRIFEVSDVVNELKKYHLYHSVSLTGGEPLLQVGFLHDLAQQLKMQNQLLYLETNGVLADKLGEIIDYIDIISMDFKLPSSTGLGSFWGQHEEFLKIASSKEVFVKSVIGMSTTIDDVLTAIKLIKKINNKAILVLQPQNPFEPYMDEKLDGFAKVCRNSKVNFIVTSQLHKKIGVK